MHMYMQAHVPCLSKIKLENRPKSNVHFRYQIDEGREDVTRAAGTRRGQNGQDSAAVEFTEHV